MLKASTTPKRGAQFTHQGKTVYLNNIKSNGLYLVSSDPKLGLDAEYYEVDADDLRKAFKVVRPIGKGKPSKEKLDKAKQVAKFFEEQIPRIPGCCENCKNPFGFVPEYKLKWLMAHICPKRSIESVMCEPENLMFVCYDCHAQYDKMLSSEIKLMPAYPLIVQRFERFKHLIPREEYKSLPDYLLELV
jgi:5-methylcytosine-specific restriction endonuclease McrA